MTKQARWRARRLAAARDQLGNRCAQCGHDGSTERLEFDHIDPSTKSFGLTRSASESAFWTEVEKCQLLCRTCHRKKTDEEWAAKAQARLETIPTGDDSCWRGHLFSRENTKIRRNGTRACKACDAIRAAEARQRRRERRAQERGTLLFIILALLGLLAVL
jgi:hypothetical protein